MFLPRHPLTISGSSVLTGKIGDSFAGGSRETDAAHTAINASTATLGAITELISDQLDIYATSLSAGCMLFQKKLLGKQTSGLYCKVNLMFNIQAAVMLFGGESDDAGGLVEAKA